MLDVVFGSLATFLGALWCWKMRERPKLALLGPVIANALIVPAYLPFCCKAWATTPSVHVYRARRAVPAMYLFGVVATGLGEALVIYVLGLPLLSALKRFDVVKKAVAR